MLAGFCFGPCPFLHSYSQWWPAKLQLVHPSHWWDLPNSQNLLKLHTLSPDPRFSYLYCRGQDMREKSKVTHEPTQSATAFLRPQSCKHLANTSSRHVCLNSEWRLCQNSPYIASVLPIHSSQVDMNLPEASYSSENMWNLGTDIQLKFALSIHSASDRRHLLHPDWIDDLQKHLALGNSDFINLENSYKDEKWKQWLQQQALKESSE